jgi:hypothetical protein
VHQRGRSPEAHGGRRARGAEDARRGRSTSPRRPRPTCSLRGQHDQAGPATVLRAVRECVATSLVSEMSSFRVRGCDPSGPTYATHAVSPSSTETSGSGSSNRSRHAALADATMVMAFARPSPSIAEKSRSAA